MAKTQKRKRCLNGTRRNPVTKIVIYQKTIKKVVSEPIPKR